MIDDSIVRGTTCDRIVTMLRKAGAKEVHLRISSPPFTWPCYYGTDIPSKGELIACKHTVDEICKISGADSLGYLPADKLSQMLLNKANGICTACFTGNTQQKYLKNYLKVRKEAELTLTRSLSRISNNLPISVFLR